MKQRKLFASNYNEDIIEVYDTFREWLTARNVALSLRQCQTEDEVIEHAHDADIYLAYKFPVTKRIIESLPNLELLMSSGSGYDHIDVHAATDNGIVVTNCSTYNAEDVAEHTVALILACARKLHLTDRAVRRGQWPCGILAQPVYRLVDRTVGIIGFGNVGRGVAWRVRGLGMNVIAYDPYTPASTMHAHEVTKVELEDLLQQSDFVSLHVRLDEATRHLLGEAQFKMMKDIAYVINTSRGGVIDEASLINALELGWIAGAGLDVLEHEPPAEDSALFQMENVIITGHGAGTTVDGMEAWQQEWRNVLDRFLAGRWPPNVVNPEVRPRTRFAETSS